VYATVPLYSETMIEEKISSSMRSARVSTMTMSAEFLDFKSILKSLILKSPTSTISSSQIMKLNISRSSGN
jgi:hypothetical protein